MNRAHRKSHRHQIGNLIKQKSGKIRDRHFLIITHTFIAPRNCISTESTMFNVQTE